MINIKGIEMYISPTHGTATVACELHGAEQLEKARYAKGYFFLENDFMTMIKSLGGDVRIKINNASENKTIKVRE